MKKSILNWMLFLATASMTPFPSPAAPLPEGQAVSIFDGKTLKGWEGDTGKWWRVKDGAIVGGSLNARMPYNDFLATTRNYTNFVLRLKFRLLGSEGFVNSGVQIRSQRVPNSHEMAGYQCDMGDPNWWGSLYDESRRNKLMAQSDIDAIKKVLKHGEWNDYVIRAEGRRIRTAINGVQGIDYTEADPKIPQWGRIGMQVHGGGITEVWFKDISIEELPADE
jgi:3-keto-disaccharide hydrolase